MDYTIYKAIYFSKNLFECVKSTLVYTIWKYIWKYFLQNNKTLKSKHFTFLNFPLSRTKLYLKKKKKKRK